MMRSLFIKIFLWFWLATIIIIGTTLVLMSVIEPYRPVRENGRHVKRLSHEGQSAVEILERGGPDALQNYLQERERRPGSHIFLFNEKGETATGRHAPQKITELAARARASGVTEFLNEDRSFLLARPVYGSDGRSYVVAGEVPRRPYKLPIWRFLNPRFLSIRLLVIFIVASIFCSWLAWYLTAPVRTLRRAAQQLASGDLKTRVGPGLGLRRDELADLGHDFDVMAERIESLMNSQTRFLRDISHELRSPLARLNVALEIARQRSGQESLEPLDRIEREAKRLNELIGQLRTLTVLESGAVTMNKSPIDFSSLVQEIAEDADFEAKTRNRSVRVIMKDSVVIHGSGELMHRAIENVVRNAVRYTAEGTAVEITLQRQHKNGSECAVLRVRDHGPGVPASALDSLFRPFYRISDARDRLTGGMGIGLSITDRAIKLHGGMVKAENAHEGGLLVEIELPL